MLRHINTLAGRMVLYLVAALLVFMVFGMTVVHSQLVAPRDVLKNQMQLAADTIIDQQAKGWENDLSTDELSDRGILRLTRTSTSAISEDALRSTSVAEELKQLAGLSPTQNVFVAYGPRAGLLRSIFDYIDADGIAKTGVLEVLNVSVETAPGEWLNVSVAPAWHRSAFDFPFFMPLLPIVIVGVVGAIIAQRATRPLNEMAKASMRLADDYVHEPIPLRGPVDVQDALRAYNDMGKRLEATVTRQRELLSAIGHDLRTPITSLRLRTEMLSDPAEKGRITRALDELETMTEAALSLASIGHSGESPSLIDMSSLVESLCEDLDSIGMPVHFSQTFGHPIVLGRAGELVRATRNLIENAVRYGGCAKVSLQNQANTCSILIEDEGPGIDPSQHELVFHPLVRLESSRNKDTGGHGLGLHIAKSIAMSHGGEITLENLQPKGFLARLSLPVTHQAGMLA
ncbi:MAG: ATP-binding protein [Henriciella sp.]|nr:ATP-binding protein [Henriciella sp.]